MQYDWVGADALGLHALSATVNGRKQIVVASPAQLNLTAAHDRDG
jgi:hypothetical protein